MARIFNTYGPRMQPKDGCVVSSSIVQVLKGEPTTSFGDGSQPRSFCYFDDMVDELIRLVNMPNDVTGPVNLGNSVEFTLRNLCDLVLTLTGGWLQVYFAPLPPDDPNSRSRISRWPRAI